MEERKDYIICPNCKMPVSYKSKICEFCNEYILSEYEQQFLNLNQYNKSIYNDITNKPFLLNFLPTKRTIKKILIALLILVLIFILNNIIIFIGIIESTKNQSFSTAKAYMLSAEKINELYIFPLSHMTKWEHPVTKPFYFIRDKLYNTGLSKFPKKEGEKEVWWYKIRYVEYRELVEDNLIKYTLNRETSIPKYLFSKVDRFNDWDNELYNHIQSIAKAKITDKKFSKFKLEMFTQLALSYEEMNDLLVTKRETLELNKKLNETYDINGIYRAKIRWVSDKEVKKYNEIYQTYVNLLEFSKIHDKESFNYFFDDENRQIWGTKLVFDISHNILVSRFYNNKLDCNDKYLKIHADVHKKIRDFYYKNEKKLSSGMRIKFSMDTSTYEPLIAYKCRSNKYFKDYTDSCFAFIKKFNSPKYKPQNWQDVKKR